MKKKLNINYDDKYDSLFLYTRGDYGGSVEKFGLIIDLTKNNSIKGVEILDASLFLSKISDSKITKKNLKELKKSFLEVRCINDTLLIQIDLKLKENDLLIPLRMEIPSYISIH